MPSKNTLEILIKASDSASSVIAGMMKSVTGNMDAMGKSMLKTGSIMVGATAPFVAGLASAVNTAANFDESMTNVGAVLGKSKTEMQALNAEVLAIGAASRAGPQVASEAFYDIVGGVADASTHMAILEAAIATAEAGSADLGGTTSALIAIMNSYGFSAEEAAFASDVLTQTVGAGVGSMEEFAAAMPQVAGLASSLGIGFDDLGASMAFLTTKGFSASQSANQLRAMMVSMLNPNEKMAQSLEEIGFASGAAAIEQLGLVGAFDALAGGSDTFNTNMAGAVGSVEALNGVIALTDESFQQFEDDFIASAEGATDAARKIQLDSFAAQMDILNSSVEALKIQIGLALLPVITRLVRAAQPVVQGLIAWANANRPLVATIGKVIAGIAAFGVVLTAAGGALTLVGALVGALISPLGLIVAAVALLGVAISENFMGLGDIFKSLVNGVKQFAGELTSAFDEGGFAAVGQLILDKLASGLSSVITWTNDHIITPITNAINTGDWSGITGKLNDLLDQLLAVVTPIADTVYQLVIRPVIDYLKDVNWGDIPGQLNELLGNLLGGTTVTQVLKDKIWTPLTTGLGDSTEIQTISTQAGEIGRQILEGIARALGSIASWVSTNIITPIITQLTGGGGDERGGGGVGGAGESMGISILRGIASAFMNITSWVLTNIIEPFILGLTGEDNLASVRENAISIAANVLDGILEGLGDLPEFVLNDIIIPLGQAIVAKAPDVVDYALKIGEQIVQGILKALAGIGQKILDAIKAEISALGGNDILPGVSLNDALGAIGFAGGGTVKGGAPIIVGEKGPELFVPQTGGQIIPNHKIGMVSSASGTGGEFYDLNGATFVFPNVTDARQFYDDLKREARRRNQGLGTQKAGVG